MLKILYTFIAIYLALLVMLFLFQRRMIYFPTTLSDHQLAGTSPFELIEVPGTDGLVIKSWRFMGDPTKKTFIFFHGNAGNAADRMPMMRVLVEAGHSVVLAEYRGYGNNPGKPTEKDIISDGEKLVEHITSEGISEQDIIIMGRSLGTGAATQLSVKYDIAALILISPFSSLADVASEIYPYFPVSLLMRDRFNSAEAISKTNTPIIMFHGELDATVPIKFGRKLFETAPEPKQFIPVPLYGHNDLNMDQINREVLKIITKAVTSEEAK